MTKFILGVVVGIVVASVGFGGIARIADKGVQTIQQQSRDLAQ
jgi:hypothetical protein